MMCKRTAIMLSKAGHALVGMWGADLQRKQATVSTAMRAVSK